MASSLDGTDAPEMPQPRIPGRFLVEQQQPSPRINESPQSLACLRTVILETASVAGTGTFCPQHMGFPVHAAALPRLSLILLLWSCGPGGQSQELQFGPCRVEGVVLQKLWEAFRAVKDIVEAESCYLIHALLKFYLDTVFRNYRRKAAEFRILRSLSTLANNFIVIVSKLQLSCIYQNEYAQEVGCLFSRDVNAIAEHLALRESQVTFLSSTGYKLPGLAKRADARGHKAFQASSIGVKPKPEKSFRSNSEICTPA
ncbi:hypothetical protein CB1_000597013 [Camelus ferus]|nr:hypothetical protein CB1_000597013 [Camelus ferus]